MTSTSDNDSNRNERLDEAVLSYFEAVESGQRPDRSEWLARYPDLTAELLEFLDDQEKVDRWTRPLQGAATPSSAEDMLQTSGGLSRKHALIGGGRVGDYELLSEIAHGGMGVVYRARQLSLNRVVALKMVLAGRLASTAEMRRFRIETEAAASLDHPNIMPVYEVDNYEGRPYFSMKLVEGGSLTQKLPQYGGDGKATARLMIRVARAVHHAHQRGVLHRDLKPDNILLDSHQQPYVADFGLARPVEGGSDVTHSGAIVGTPSYMAPEQAAGRKDLTTGADIYSLGAIMYAMLTARPPFRANTPLETVRQVIDNEPSRPRLLNPSVNRDLETICLKCLQKDPLRRYGSAEALAKDLERWIAGEPIHARRSGIVERLYKRARRNPASAALAAFGVVAVLLMIGWGAWYQDRLRREAEQKLDRVERMATRRSNMQDLIRDGRSHLAAMRWQEAKLSAAEAIALAKGALEDLPDETSLQEHQHEAEELLESANRNLTRQQARRKLDERLALFFRLHDEVLFRGTLFTELSLPANVESTLTAGERALRLFGMSLEDYKPPVLDALLHDEEKAQITKACYELLILLAEAEARRPDPQLELAEDLLQRSLQLGPPTRAHYLRRARYRKMRGDQGGADEYVQLARKVEPTTALDHFLIGYDLRRQENLPAAITEFYAALQKQQNYFWAQYLLAVCYLENDPQTAKAYLTACINQRSELESTYLLRGIASGRLKQFTEAENDFQRALEHADSGLIPGDDVRYAVLVSRGAVRGWQSRHAEAAADLRAAIEINPHQYQAYWNLGEIHRRQGRTVAALEQLGLALQSAQVLAVTGELEQRTLALLHQKKAEIHLQGEDWDAALRDSERALEAAPFAESHLVCGRVMFVRKNFRGAIAAYESALSSPPANKQEFNLADVYRRQADALVMLKDYQAAARSLDLFLQHGGQPDAALHRLRGLSRAQARDYSAAIDDYTLALVLDPNDSATHAYRGWVYFVQGALKLALDDFEQAIRIDPDNGDAYNGRGYVRVKLGYAAAAIRDADQALRCGLVDARTAWNAARIHSLAVNVLDSDPRRRSPLINEMRSKAYERALQLLRQAVDLTSPDARAVFWQSVVQSEKNGVFAAIRSSPQFQRMEKDYAQEAQQTSRR